MESKSWFEVDKDGLKELQLGKPKSYILRELIQNAWDENITRCVIEMQYERGVATISVEDDNPEGFKDLRDSFTLFKHTYKRADPTKRGRFNIGEKQAISICDEAIIETTKGTVIFDKDGRTLKKSSRSSGSKITVKLKVSKEDFDEIETTLKVYLTPKNVATTINGAKISYIEPYKTIDAKLTTELENDDRILRRISRDTKVQILKNAGHDKYLYEIGIPVAKIDCEYSINVLQKIPLGVDRETVSEAFLKDVFAEVLNSTYEEIQPEQSSQLWVREATTDERINLEAVKTVVKKRFGDKVVVANPFDKNSIDEAISKGYNVIYGSEMSKEEWERVRENQLIPSSTDLFGGFGVSFEVVKDEDLTLNETQFRTFAKKVARTLMDVDLKVVFIKSKASSTMADYNSGDKTMRLNLSKLSAEFFKPPINEHTIALLLHELGHEAGNHTEYNYQEYITKLAGGLVMLSLKNPKWFDF